MPDISGIADLLFTERFSLLFIENSIADYGKKDRNLAMNGNRKPENGEKMSINISCNRNSKACIIKTKRKTCFIQKNVQPCQAASDSIYKLQFIRFKNRGFIYERKI